MPSPAWRRLLDEGALDAELGGLLWLLGEQGVPIVVASRDPRSAELLTAVLPGTTGTLLADSLEEVVRLAGGSVNSVPDELREMGVVVVVRRVAGRPLAVAAHYIRPLERDAGGHVQRRGPAVLAAWDEASGEWAHFAWGIAAELAERCGLGLAEFERERQRRAVLLERG